MSFLVPLSLEIFTIQDTYHSIPNYLSVPDATFTTMTTCTTTISQTQPDDAPRLAIKKEHLPGLDPQWVGLWHTHGARMVRADELSIEEYRKSPALYSFTYPTCEGTFQSYLGVCSNQLIRL